MKLDNKIPSARRKMAAAVCFMTLGMALWAVLPLNHRWREESRDRRVTLAVDWNEFRDFSARLEESDAERLRDLRVRGVSAVVLSPLTLMELVQQRRVQRLEPLGGIDPLDVAQLRFSDPALARQVFAQWSWRNTSGLEMQSKGATIVLSRRQSGFASLKDINVGFDLLLLEEVRAAGLTPILRIFEDPWLSDTYFKEWLNQWPAPSPHMGLLFSSDDLPGGSATVPWMRSWILRHQAIQFLPEFRPAASAWQMAYALPPNTFRAHSISPAELKDLKFEQQLARWYRAVEERSARLLLIRVAPNDSRESFLSSLFTLRSLLNRHDWQIAFPLPRLAWQNALTESSQLSGIHRWGRALLALGIVSLAPFLALQWARSALPQWRWTFARIFFGCLLGALMAAAVSQTSLTRVQIIPFRGVKWAFLFSWSLVFFSLYDFSELREKLSYPLRRWDLLIGALAVAALGYLVLRSGNAPAAWKPSWEQSLRNMLEMLLVARPRFKEFAIGYPALWMGCYIQSLYQQGRFRWDGRALIWIGMLGPISMINTFCHLHSPLVLGLWRSFNGLILGILLGSLMIGVFRLAVVLFPRLLTEKEGPRRGRRSSPSFQGDETVLMASIAAVRKSSSSEASAKVPAR